MYHRYFPFFLPIRGAIIILSLFVAVSCFGQNKKISQKDSLFLAGIRQQYNNTINSDARKADSLGRIFFGKAEDLQNDLHLGQGAAYISSANFLLKNKTEALKWYQTAEAFLIKAKSDVWLGHVNLYSGKKLAGEYSFDEALPYFLKAVKHFGNAGEKKNLANTYNAISLAYHDFGDYAKGREYATLALQTILANPDVNQYLQWYAFNNLGINYDDDKQYQQAIENHRNALPWAETASDSSFSFNNLGNTFKKLEQFDTASYYFALALKSADDYGDMYHLATIYSNLLDIERLKKNYSKANSFIDSAAYYAHKSESPEKLIDFNYYIYQLKKEMGDSKAASDYLQRYVTLKDSLFTSEKTKILYDYQIRYETEKKEKEIAENKLASERKSIWLISLAGFILLGLIMFWNYRNRSLQRRKRLSLENELLREHTQSKMKEQRLEISRDLHDSLGAQLTFINSTLESLKRSSAVLDDTVNSKINTLSDFSENSISELKNALWVLNSTEINLDGLRSKILNFINNASEAKEDIQFHFDFDVTEDFQLPSKYVVNLFRVVQEIVNNALKYANATDIAISAKQSASSLLITISDNGVGFDAVQEKGRSFGLANIESRIAEINGSLQLVSGSGIGTTYTITIAVS